MARQIGQAAPQGVAGSKVDAAGQARQGQAPRSLQPVLLMRCMNMRPV